MDDRRPSALVAYSRVPTRHRGASGPGFEADREAIGRHPAAAGRPVVARHAEVESGRRSDRPEPTKAPALAKRPRAGPVAARLDRLARNDAFLADPMESGVEFVACDQPGANRLTLRSRSRRNFGTPG